MRDSGSHPTPRPVGPVRSDDRMTGRTQKNFLQKYPTLNYFKMPREGFEPPTISLRGSCSTNWANRAYILPPEGFEPPTSWSEAKRSIQLSYEGSFSASPQTRGRSGGVLKRLLSTSTSPTPPQLRRGQNISKSYQKLKNNQPNSNNKSLRKTNAPLSVLIRKIISPSPKPLYPLERLWGSYPPETLVPSLLVPGFSLRASADWPRHVPTETWQ